MGLLYRYEMKKLLNRKLTWLLLAVCVGILLNFDYTGMVASKDFVRGMKDVYAKYEGKVLTDSLAKEALADSEAFAAAHDGEFGMVDNGETQELGPTGQDDYCSGAWQAFSQITHGSTREYYLESAARDQACLDNGCHENGKQLTQDERAWLKNNIAVLTTRPPVVHYAEGWERLSLCNQFIGMFPLFLLALCLTPLFSGERTAKLEGILLCAAKRRRASTAKLLAALTVTLAIFIVLYGAQLLVVALTYGLNGAMSSAYYSNWGFARTDRTLIGIFAGQALVWLSAMFALAFLAALFSSASRNTLTAMLMYAALIAVHIVLVNVVNSEFWHSLEGPVWQTVSKIVYLLPVNALYDGEAGAEIGMILSDLRYVAGGLLLSLSLAAAAAASAQALYQKRRKA